MLRIRFSRVGKKNAPSFRLVLTPQTSPPKGKFLEILGFYNPRTKDKGLHSERILHWISKGAQPSDTAHNFLVKEGVIEGKKVSVHSTAKRKQKETAEKAPATTEEAPATADVSPEASAKEEAGQAEIPTEETSTTEEKSDTSAEETPAEEKPAVPEEAPATEEPAKEVDNN